MAQEVKPEALRTAIASEIAEMKAYDVPAECERLGLAPGDEGEAFGGKFRYVMARLRSLDLPRLLDVAQRFLDDRDAPALAEVLSAFGHRGVDGDFKNLIFAADGPKPELVFADAVNNDVKIVKNAEHCLIYSRPLLAPGLTWRDLVAWWREAALDMHDADEAEVGRSLYKRLYASLASPPEQTLFRVYCSLYSLPGGFDLPALVPQVYLHYDPLVARLRRGPAPLARQRMDFLLLLPRRERVVVEVDGVQHYADDEGRASPRLYSEMVAEDRRLRLTGYEVHRFGGHELMQPEAGGQVLAFFRQLFDQRGMSLPEVGT